jgi:hypothetical protein
MTALTENDPRIWLRPNSSHRYTYRCGHVYIHINKDDDNRPFRIFFNKGHTGHCQQALLEAVARLVTLIIQETNLPIERVHKTLIGIDCGEGHVRHKSCIDNLAQLLKSCGGNQETLP